MTGADGFVGEHLVRRLVEERGSVVGAIHGTAPRLRILDASVKDAVEWRPLELRDAESVRRLAREVRPDEVVHLAGIASGVRSRQQPAATLEVNVVGTHTLLDALAGTVPGARVLSVGTGNAYGHPVADRPLREDDPLRPRGPYATSKACQEVVALEFARTGRLHVVATRSFGHTGPGQRPPYVVPDWAHQLLDRSAGPEGPVVHVGRLDLERDFCDVRDVVRAYDALLTSAPSGSVYNVCSGVAVSLSRVLELTAQAAGVPEPSVRVSPERERTDEPRRVVGDPRRLRALTGWEPMWPLESTIADLVSEMSTSGVAA